MAAALTTSALPQGLAVLPIGCRSRDFPPIPVGRSVEISPHSLKPDTWTFPLSPFAGARRVGRPFHREMDFPARSAVFGTQIPPLLPSSYQRGPCGSDGTRIAVSGLVLCRLGPIRTRKETLGMAASTMALFPPLTGRCLVVELRTSNPLRPMPQLLDTNLHGLWI